MTTVATGAGIVAGDGEGSITARANSLDEDSAGLGGVTHDDELAGVGQAVAADVDAQPAAVLERGRHAVAVYAIDA